MPRGSRYPKGSPKDILARLYKAEREVRQILTDVQSVNDNNRNFADTPMDVGRYIVQLKKFKEVIAKVKAAVDAGQPQLPSGILDHLCEKW